MTQASRTRCVRVQGHSQRQRWWQRCLESRTIPKRFTPFCCFALLYFFLFGSFRGGYGQAGAAGRLPAAAAARGAFAVQRSSRRRRALAVGRRAACKRCRSETVAGGCRPVRENQSATGHRRPKLPRVCRNQHHQPPYRRIGKVYWPVVRQRTLMATMVICEGCIKK